MAGNKPAMRFPNPDLGTPLIIYFSMAGNFRLPRNRKAGRFPCLQSLQKRLVGWIAQLVEQRTENPCVPSSILGPATILKKIARLSAAQSVPPQFDILCRYPCLETR
jgi:hypothetical protein